MLVFLKSSFTSVHWYQVVFHFVQCIFHLELFWWHFILLAKRDVFQKQNVNCVFVSKRDEMRGKKCPWIKFVKQVLLLQFFRNDPVVTSLIPKFIPQNCHVPVNAALRVEYALIPLYRGRAKVKINLELHGFL